MRAAYFYGVGDIRYEEVPKPEICENEVLLKVHAAALCGTDLRIYKSGHYRIQPGEKRALCHEFAGEIAEAGSKVKGWRVGQRVSVVPNVGCGSCPMCLRGLNQLCPDYMAFGVCYDGGLSEYVRIPQAAVERGNLVEIPDDLSYEEAALIEPFACTVHSRDMLKTEPGDTVVIIGAGPIGACHVMINSLAGASKILVADISDTRLEEIRKFGADVVINSAREDLAEAVRRETNGFGADVVITACSVPEIQELALELAAPRGRINLFGGMPKGKETVPLYTNHIHYNELHVLATTGCCYSDYRAGMRIAASRSLPLKNLISRVWRIEEVQEAFAFALSGQGMKNMIRYD